MMQFAFQPAEPQASAGESFLYPEGENTLWVNSGRAAMECLLHGLPHLPQRVWLPRFVCDTLAEPLVRLQIPVNYYGVDARLHPQLPQEIAAQDALVLVNYFGLTGEAVAAAAAAAPCPVLVDATTALYCPPLPGVGTFYSPRKFAGLADGGVAVGQGLQGLPLADDAGSDARTRLLMQECSEAAVEAAEAALSGAPKRMGHLTRHLMQRIPWQRAAAARLRHYDMLHRALAGINRLHIPEQPVHAPMCYPLVSGIPGLRDALIDAGVKLPLFWPEVIERTHACDAENRLARTLLPLPLDQRYTCRDMQRLIDLVLH